VDLPLPDQARRTLRRYTMLAPGDTILAGLSGGADSVALLHWLCSVKEEYGLGLTAAHFNHGLRGAESDGDEAFCRDLCAGLGLPLHVRRANVKELARQQGVGIEEAGRNARYEFFAALHCKVALAHTLSDRAETLLMNIARGAALRGLCSIPPVRKQFARGNEQFAIIRPLIECTRAQVERYCEENGLAYRTDGSNFDTGYRRNYIRHEVLPLLRLESGPLRRVFAALEADEAYLSALAAQHGGDPLEAPEAIKNRLLRKMLADAGREPSLARMLEEEKRLRANPAGAARRPIPPAKTLKIEELPEDFTKNLPEMPKEGLANCLDYDTITGTLAQGRRLAGDSMRLCNGAGTKSFKKLCQERGIPPGERESLALARDDLGLVWIEGFGCAHRCRITRATKHAVRIAVREE
jgi:tRNA(Ile)-lysidine synthase